LDNAKNAKLGRYAASRSKKSSSNIERGDLLDILEYPNPERYAGQRILVVQREDYVYLVPFPPSPASGPRGLRRGLAVALRAEGGRRGRAHGVLEDDHPEPEGHEAVSR
jgi:hypothetical protein